MATEEEQDYLIAFANNYFEQDISRGDVVWTYSGVRPLYDDGAKSATAATRDYVLSLDLAGPALLSIFGGKITTFRKLAENVMHKLQPQIGGGSDWTANVALPGGDFEVEDVAKKIQNLQMLYPFLSEAWATRLIRAYGTDAELILGDATTVESLGVNFGATLTEAEVLWLMTKEYARTAEDVLWRRSKLGLRFEPSQVAALEAFMQAA